MLQQHKDIVYRSADWARTARSFEYAPSSEVGGEVTRSSRNEDHTLSKRVSMMYCIKTEDKIGNLGNQSKSVETKKTKKIRH